MYKVQSYISVIIILGIISLFYSIFSSFISFKPPVVGYGVLSLVLIAVGVILFKAFEGVKEEFLDIYKRLEKIEQLQKNDSKS